MIKEKRCLFIVPQTHVKNLWSLNDLYIEGLISNLQFQANVKSYYKQMWHARRLVV